MGCGTVEALGRRATPTEHRDGTIPCAGDASVSPGRRSNGTRRTGIDRFIASLLTEAQGDKLSAFRWRGLDISDQPTATYWASQGAAVYQQFLDGINRGDVAAVTALFADDAVFQGARDCTLAAPCAGKEPIRQAVERLVGDQVRLTATDPRLFAPFGSVTTVIDTLGMVADPAAGQPASASITLKVRGGKIASATFTSSGRD